MERRIKFWGRGDKEDREVERKSKKGITGKRKRMRQAERKRRNLKSDK